LKNLFILATTKTSAQISIFSSEDALDLNRCVDDFSFLSQFGQHKGPAILVTHIVLISLKNLFILATTKTSAQISISF
jgi:hypothetical protein